MTTGISIHDHVEADADMALDPPPELAHDAADTEQLLLNGETFAITALIEALLFVADGPVEVTQLAKALQLDNEAVYYALQQLDQQYVCANRGLRVQEYCACKNIMARFNW